MTFDASKFPVCKLLFEDAKLSKLASIRENTKLPKAASVEENKIKKIIYFAHVDGH